MLIQVKSFFRIFLLPLFIGCVFSGCNSNTSDDNTKEQLSCGDFEGVSKLNSDFLNNPNNIRLATDLYLACLAYEKECAADQRIHTVLEFGAAGAEAALQFKLAAEIYERLISNYPESENTVVYFWNKGRLLENNLNKKKGAEDTYKKMIDRYPNHPLSRDMKVYLESGMLEMNEEQQIQFLEKVGKEGN